MRAPFLLLKILLAFAYFSRKEGKKRGFSVFKRSFEFDGSPFRTTYDPTLTHQRVICLLVFLRLITLLTSWTFFSSSFSFCTAAATVHGPASEGTADDADVGDSASVCGGDAGSEGSAAAAAAGEPDAAGSPFTSSVTLPLALSLAGPPPLLADAMLDTSQAITMSAVSLSRPFSHPIHSPPSLLLPSSTSAPFSAPLLPTATDRMQKRLLLPSSSPSLLLLLSRLLLTGGGGFHLAESPWASSTSLSPIHRGFF